MANDKKITGLPEVTTVEDTDYATVVRPSDPVTTRNKKISGSNLKKSTSKWLSDGSIIKAVIPQELDQQDKKIINMSDPENSKDGVNKKYADNLLKAAGIGIDFFLSNTPDPIIAGYNSMFRLDTEELKSTVSATITAPDTLIKSFITVSTQPDFILLLKGINTVHTHLAKTAGTKDVTVYYKIYKYSSLDVETLLFTTEISPLLTGSEIPYDLAYSVPADTDLVLPDRLVVKAFGTPSGLGTDPEVTIYMEEKTFSRIEVNTTSEILGVNSRMIFSGQVAGGEPSINVDPTKTNVSEGYGYITDNSDPDNTIRVKIPWPEFTAVTVDNLLTASGTFLGINFNSQLIQQVADFEPEQIAPVNIEDGIIRLGRLGHFGRTVITKAFYYPFRYLSADFDWAMDVILKGTVNIKGNIFSENGANLRLNKSEGLSHRIGANYSTNKNNPNIPRTPQVDQIQFSRGLRDGVTGSSTLTHNVSISTLTRSGTTVTATSSGTHYLSTSMDITMSGADQSEYNGKFEITGVPTSTTFTYEIVGTPVTPATGTIIGIYGATRDLDPKRWDDNGALTDIPNFDYSIIEMIHYPNNSEYTAFAIYGQKIYNSFTLGKADLISYRPIINSDIFGAADRSLILIREDVTDLTAAISGGTALIREITSGTTGDTEGFGSVDLLRFPNAVSWPTTGLTEKGIIGVKDNGGGDHELRSDSISQDATYKAFSWWFRRDAGSFSNRAMYMNEDELNIGQKLLYGGTQQLAIAGTPGAKLDQVLLDNWAYPQGTDTQTAINMRFATNPGGASIADGPQLVAEAENTWTTTLSTQNASAILQVPQAGIMVDGLKIGSDQKVTLFNDLILPNGALIDVVDIKSDSAGAALVLNDNNSDDVLACTGASGANFGIGVYSPSTKLHVQDDAAFNVATILATNTARRGVIQLEGSSTGDANTVSASLVMKDTDNSKTGSWAFDSGISTSQVEMWIEGGRRFLIDADGHVGIGVASAPFTMLKVDQSSTTAAIPTLILDQADTSEPIIDFRGQDKGVVPTSTADSIGSIRVIENGAVVGVLAIHANQGPA